MPSGIDNKSTAEISQEMRKTFDLPSAGVRPFPGLSPRTGAVEAWLDLRRKTDEDTRLKIDDAIGQALVSLLADDSSHPETVCAHLRLLRLASQENLVPWSLTDDARNAILKTTQSGRLKDVKTSYGDAHAEILACVEALHLAPDFYFWRIQMSDPRYVTNATSGCLGSENPHWALSGILQAVKFRDPSLALALMRLFRIFQGRENLVWARFAEARRITLWNEEDYDLVRRAMAQLGQSCPDDLALRLEQLEQLEQEVDSLQRLVDEEKSRRQAAETAEKKANQALTIQRMNYEEETDAYLRDLGDLVENYKRTRAKGAASTKQPIRRNR